MKHSVYLISLLVSLLALSACQSAPNAVALQTQAHSWIDAPLGGSYLPLAPVDIIAHSSDLVNIVSIELSVNGNVIATIPNTEAGRLLAIARQTWTPPAPGNYTVRVRALNSSSVWGEYAQADVTVGLPTPTPPPLPAQPPIVPPSPAASVAANTNTPAPSDTPTIAVPSPTGTLKPPTATHTPAPKPTATHTHTPTKTEAVVTKPVLTDHSVSAALFYWGGGNCTPKEVTIKASASDPVGIAGVHLLFKLASQANWTDLAMSGSGEIWSRTLVSDNDIPGYSSVTTGSTPLQFYFVLTNTKGGQTQSQTFSGVSLEYCPAIK